MLKYEQICTNINPTKQLEVISDFVVLQGSWGLEKSPVACIHTDGGVRNCEYDVAGRGFYIFNCNMFIDLYLRLLSAWSIDTRGERLGHEAGYCCRR